MSLTQKLNKLAISGWALFNKIIIDKCMDLLELTNNAQRHPWESARVHLIRSILKSILRNRLRVLDVGCGDAFVIKKIFSHKASCVVNGIDINLTDTQVEKFTVSGFHLYNKFVALGNKKYDLILLLDVVEHLEDDVSLLRQIIKKHLANDGHALVTAPAFQSLFSSHDRFLKHFRRYNLKQIKTLVRKCEMRPVYCGYFFFTLMFIRIILNSYSKLAQPPNRIEKGVGAWQQKRYITQILELILVVEGQIMLLLTKLGVKLPGLTVWSLCKKQQ